MFDRTRLLMAGWAMDIPVTDRERKNLSEHVDRCELRWKQNRILLYILGALVIGTRLTQGDIVSKLFGH